MQPRRLLLVEDEPGLVLTLTDRLTAEGYEVEQAATGEEAIRIASWFSPDVAIVDLYLPTRDRVRGEWLTCLRRRWR